MVKKAVARYFQTMRGNYKNQCEPSQANKENRNAKKRLQAQKKQAGGQVCYQQVETTSA
jgi:hypothetical protein